MKKENHFKNLDFKSVKPNNLLSEKIEDEMTKYFYRNIFNSFQQLYNYIVDYVEYLEYMLKINNIKFNKKDIK